jgi:hypothetical protein
MPLMPIRPQPWFLTSSDLVLPGLNPGPCSDGAARLPEQPPALGDHLLLHIPRGQVCDPEALT